MVREVLFVQTAIEHAEPYLDVVRATGYRPRLARVPQPAAGPGTDRPALCVLDVSGTGADLTALSRSLPGTPVIAWTDRPTVAGAVAAVRAGAVDYVDRRISKAEFARKIDEHVRATPEAAFIAASERGLRTFELADRVAGTDVSVLINGESGTGKEVVARYVHTASHRSDGPFVAINCAAIPDQMLEAILFGHERGAFTGATQSQAGKFELADGGTLLLDEITEMPLGLQSKLLRVLQEREVERVGGRAPKSVDVRVVATSNRRLNDAIADGSFREDLFYRLSVFPIEVAPLRERLDEIGLLARHFIEKHTPIGDAPPVLDDAVEARLRAHDWPGNVRELENVVQRALVMSGGHPLNVADLGLEPARSSDTSLSHRVRESEDAMLLNALRDHDGRRRDTAAALGISERTLRNKLRRLREAGITVDDNDAFRRPAPAGRSAASRVTPASAANAGGLS